MHIYIYYKELAHMIMGAVKFRPRITNYVNSNSSLKARSKTVRQRERILSYLNFYSIQAFKGLDEA